MSQISDASRDFVKRLGEHDSVARRAALAAMCTRSLGVIAEHLRIVGDHDGLPRISEVEEALWAAEAAAAPAVISAFIETHLPLDPDESPVPPYGGTCDFVVGALELAFDARDSDSAADSLVQHLLEAAWDVGRSTNQDPSIFLGAELRRQQRDLKLLRRDVARPEALRDLARRESLLNPDVVELEPGSPFR